MISRRWLGCRLRPTRTVRSAYACNMRSNALGMRAWIVREMSRAASRRTADCVRTVKRAMMPVRTAAIAMAVVALVRSRVDSPHIAPAAAPATSPNGAHDEACRCPGAGTGGFLFRSAPRAAAGRRRTRAVGGSRGRTAAALPPRRRLLQAARQYLAVRSGWRRAQFEGAHLPAEPRQPSAARVQPR